MHASRPLDNLNETKPKVAIQRCEVYDSDKVFSALKSSIDLLGGIDLFFKRGERVLLKPNLLVAKPAEAAATTHPSIVKAAISLVKEAGAIPIVGDSPGVGSAIKVARKCGIADLCKEMGVKIIDLKDSVTVLNPNGKTFKRFEVAKEALEVDAILNLPKAKTHAQMFLTLGIKNLFGCVVGKRKPQWHLSAGIDTNYFARMLVDLYLLMRPSLTIVDGIIGMEGNGPGSGDPRKLGLIFASSDCIALDTIITMTLGANPEELPVLKVAAEDGIGETNPCRIAIVGEKIEECRIGDFRFPEKVVSTNFSAIFPPFIERRLRKAVASRPRIEHKRCTLCDICIDTCPPGIMTKESKIMIEMDSCISCFCCQEMCPHGAITSKRGWLARLIK
ncbi:MAG: DUF362 domain-containing protein [Thermodesulfobacteriota bacterium]